MTSSTTFPSSVSPKPWAHLPPEFQEMLDKDMTLGQATKHMTKHFGFPRNAPIFHETAHLLLGLAGVPDYQGCDASEEYIYAVNQPQLPSDMSMQQRVDRVMDGLKTIEGAANLRLTLYWLKGRETRLSYEAMRKADNHEFPELFDKTIPDICREFNLKSLKGCDVLSGHVPYPTWDIETNKGEHFFFNSECRSPSKKYTGLPEGTNGTYEFKRFHMISRDEVEAMVKRVMPMEAFIRTELAKEPFDSRVYERMAHLKLRDVYNALPPLQTAGAAIDGSVIPDACAKGAQR